MKTPWKWDAQHVLIGLAFLVGVAWAVFTAFGGQPVNAKTLMAFAPVAMLIVSHVFAFWKSPPNNPADALAQGENATKAGFASLKLLALLGVVAAIVGLVLVLEACTNPPTPKQVETDAGEVVNTIVKGVKNGESAEQIEADVGRLVCSDFNPDASPATWCTDVVSLVDEGITVAIDSGALTGLLATKASVLQTTERIKLAAHIRHSAGGAP